MNKLAVRMRRRAFCRRVVESFWLVVEFCKVVVGVCCPHASFLLRSPDGGADVEDQTHRSQDGEVDKWKENHLEEFPILWIFTLHRLIFPAIGSKHSKCSRQSLL